MRLDHGKWLFFTLSGLAFIAFGRAVALNHFALNLDQAYMVELIDTTFTYGVPLTQLTKSAIEHMRTIASQNAVAVCQMPLPLDRGPMMNVFAWHSIPIVYLIAPLRWLVDGKTIVAALTSFTFVGMMVILYATARRKKVPLVAALSFVFLATAHPVWSRGVFGQFGPDRMFMVFGLLYVIALVSYLEKDRPSFAWLMLLVVSAVLATMCTERAGIMISGYTLGCLILFRGVHFQRSDLIPVSVALIAGAYATLYMHFVQSNQDYASFASSFLPGLSSILQHDWDPLIWKFLLINALGIGVLACFHWRLGLLAAASMLPNLLGNIGGAEKTGWSTHYHTLYFTFLVAAALYGLIRLHRCYPSRLLTMPTSVGMVGCGVLLLLMNPFETQPLFALSASNIGDYAPLKVARLLTKTAASPALELHTAMVRSAAAKVPRGRSVSTIGGMMPAMYDVEAARHISVYPLGFDEVDYLVLRYESGFDNQLLFSGAASYRGPVAEKKIDECMNERVLRQGFRPIAIIPAAPGADWGIAVLHRQ